MIEKHNFHWQEGFRYDFPITRELFHTLVKETGSKQIISLRGLRRTGKTTILKQLIDYLILVHKVKREHILLYSFDEEQPPLDSLLKEYEAKIGQEILKIPHQVYIFFDEIQKLPNWQNQVKFFYDSYKNLKFFVSGSSSLFIRKQAQESLAGRMYDFILPPLSFKEFLIFRGKEELLKKPELLSEHIQTEFLTYQKRQFPEIINETEEKAGQYVQTILEKIIYQDIPKVFPIAQEDLLLKILKIVASNPGMLSDYESLSKELGISRITLSNYFFYLEESFLIKKLYNFSANLLTSEKKMKKFYLTSTSFFTFLNKDIAESKLIENLIVITGSHTFFWRTPQKYEVDLVQTPDQKIIPLEVKYAEHISDKDTQNLIRFCEKFAVAEGIMVTKNKMGQKELKLNGKNICLIFIPAWKFVFDN